MSIYHVYQEGNGLVYMLVAMRHITHDMCTRGNMNELPTHIQELIITDTKYGGD